MCSQAHLLENRMAARASTRISIRWPPEPASEPTDTLVLSLGNYYVDLRVKKVNQTIDWALAGQEIVITEEPRKCPTAKPQFDNFLLFTPVVCICSRLTLTRRYEVKIKFTYLIDSRCLDPGGETVFDVGQFVKLSNGDDLETGEMAAAHLGGQIMPYEEIWHELDSKTGVTVKDSDAGYPASFIVESVDHNMQGHDRPNLSSKTTYARVGKFFLVIQRTMIPPAQGKGLESYAYAAIRQDLDDKSYRWTNKYSVGDVSGLRTMSDEEGKRKSEGRSMSSWKVGDIVLFGSYETGEHCTVRAVSY